MRLLVPVSSGTDTHRRTVEQVIAAAAVRHDVRVLAPDPEAASLRFTGVPVESWQPSGLFDALRSIGALQRALEHHAPEAIHAAGWSAGAVVLGAGTPAQTARTIVTLLDPIDAHELPAAFVEKRLPALLRRARFVTFADAERAADAIARFELAPDHVVVLPPAVGPRADEIGYLALYRAVACSPANPRRDGDPAQ